MKTKCGNCKAYVCGGLHLNNRLKPTCALLFPIQNEYLHGVIVDSKPLVECPKPLTNKDYMKAEKYKINALNN